MSRLLPTKKLASIDAADPRNFVPLEDRQIVELRQRGTPGRLPYDKNAPVPEEYHRKLLRLDAAINRVRITYEPYDYWEDCHCGERTLRPVHFAVFTDDWDHHGRIYTRGLGYQSLRPIERETIKFDRQPSVELDFASLHPRMLYHLKGIAYRTDPYALWGPSWGGRAELRGPLRQLAKNVVNALINATGRRAAISTCNLELRITTADGKRKTGKSKRTALTLHQAIKETDLRFSDICDIALRRHAAIADQFGSDAGLRLMNLDGKIALDILSEFTDRGIPCLGCHDSFIVPAGHERLLRQTMKTAYQRRMNFLPVIGPARGAGTAGGGH